LVSDRPVGVFLSGGVDSGAIVSAMREAGHARVRTFSITFPEAEFDEGAAAARVAVRYETEHTARPVSGQDLLADLDRMEEEYHLPLAGLLVDLLGVFDPLGNPVVFNTVRRLLLGAPRALAAHEAAFGKVRALHPEA
jgi:asparagine synthetase B (glutamine-hydrolysing)